MAYKLIAGDCLDVMPTMEPNSVDAIVCDPPYGLGFMGKDWDHGVPGVQFWREALRVAKPGAHLLAFGGTRTFHRLAVAIEDAGWEIRDTVMWVYGSGFPKSHDVSKAIDREAGAVRDVVGLHERTDLRKGKAGFRNLPGSIESRGAIVLTAPATPDAERWQGWGTALKPAWEPIIVARKPFKGTVAQNVLRHGTGAINVAACRVEFQNEEDRESHQPGFYKAGNNGKHTRRNKVFGADNRPVVYHPPIGRWPANVVHDGSDAVMGLFPSETGAAGGKDNRGTHNGIFDGRPGVRSDAWGDPRDAKGSAARFFYCAKASPTDRSEGCEGLDERDGSVGDRRPSGSMSQRIHADTGRPDTTARNHHPTVKPTALMRWLVRLVTPAGGVVLDPFMGSGSTGKAARLEGFRFIGIEMNPEYVEIARRRIGAVELPLLVTNEDGY